ncbi:hypothetical protein V1264_022281 [Littorina saxatilis]|uniref:Uncharacterized protein n=2 Tax=Littorina saxatilis TaxID=31220 RepID=A0AAN9FXG9_9CAEN
MADPGYACLADMLPSGSIHAAEASTIKPNPYDPSYASADQIGISTDPQRVAYNPSTNSLKSRSANQHSDIPLQPAEPANKPHDNGVDDYNVLGGQGATSGPDPTYSHINKVNKNQ